MSSDVCFLLEGTYPYVAGGVSTWVYELIRDLSDLRFSIVYIGPSAEADREFRYPIPPNVVEFRELFLHEPMSPDGGGRPRLRAADWDRLEQFMQGMREGRPRGFDEVVREVLRPGEFPLHEVLFGEEGWNRMLRLYRRFPEEPSFLDFFWTWRFTQIPVFRVLSAPLPKARCYHSVSTGYAGLLAAAARVRTGAPMLLTEHGIYTRERRIEIAQAQWIFLQEEEREGYKESFFRDWWVRLFDAMSAVAYERADRILTLHERNRELQIAEGAEPAKIRVIPNGVNVERFVHLRPRETPGSPPVVALVGRVVPIKDIKTFLRAAKILERTVPGVRIEILGPTEEDPDYFDECLELIRMLGVEETVRFLGKVDLTSHLARVDCMVLTSISESQPLVLMEGMAAGIPLVATDVGACREMIEGVREEDRALGSCGIVTPVGSPQSTAEAVREILSDPDEYCRKVRSGKSRVRHFYRAVQVSARYHELYEEAPWMTTLSG